MNHVGKLFFVFLLVSSLVTGQSNALLAQSRVTDSVVVHSALPASNAKTATTAVLPGASRAMPAALPSSPQASGYGKHTGLVVGLALSGVGAALLAKKEPVHQTVCITYDSCPVPGFNHVTGGLMLGVGVPLTILKLVKH